MKKVLGIVLSVVLIGTSLVGCGGDKSGGDGQSSSQGKSITISVVAGSMAATAPGGIGVQAMVDKINELGGDEIKAEAFFDTQLGDAKSMVQGLQQGTIDVGVAGNSYFSSIVPEVQVLELPYMFEDYAQARAICDAEVGQELLSMFESKGMVGLKFWEIGFRHLTNNTKEVHSVEDVQGLKMRTLTAPVQVKLWEIYGALPTSIDSSELYASLQQGMVSAQENPISEIVSKKFYEVQKYMSLTGHVYTPMVLAISKQTYDKLNDAQKDILMQGVEAGTAAARQATDEAEASGIQTLKDEGMAIVEDPDIQEFSEKGKECYTIFTDQYGDEFITKINDAK